VSVPAETGKSIIRAATRMRAGNFLNGGTSVANWYRSNHKLVDSTPNVLFVPKRKSSDVRTMVPLELKPYLCITNVE